MKRRLYANREPARDRGSALMPLTHVDRHRDIRELYALCRRSLKISASRFNMLINYIYYFQQNSR